MAEKLTKKQKKASEFRTKKRKLDDSIPDVPEEDTAENAAKEEGEKKDETKAMKQKTDAKDTNTPSSTTEATADGKKKRRRGKGSKEGETEAAAVTEGETKAAPKPKPANQKFIVFVGNLPFNITKEQLQKHFESCTNITSIRVQTDKVTGKGKGFAFLELGTAEAMQKALYFNKTLIKERPINVELTAGGGGNKSASRKQKIAEKNEALNEERRKVHEKHIAPAKEAKSSYAAANPPVVQKAVKTIKKPQEISGANSITVDGLAARLRKA
ncbi:hypothetical protein BGZ74_009437 [Mortierella antarctica]|nr:hypothetical protein BGZ74_009437 [Mortierella antarctica]